MVAGARFPPVENIDLQISVADATLRGNEPSVVRLFLFVSPLCRAGQVV